MNCIKVEIAKRNLNLKSTPGVGPEMAIHQIKNKSINQIQIQIQPIKTLG